MLKSMKSNRLALRSVAAVVLFAFTMFAIAGCEPKPALTPVALPFGQSGDRLVSINDAGLAVGYFETTSKRAFTYDVKTGVATDISAIPVSTDFPGGGTFLLAGYVNDHGIVLGAASNQVDDDNPTNFDNSALYDTATGTYTRVPCTLPVRLGMRAVSDGGLVACSDELYDSTNGSTVPVAQPTGCNGKLLEVNDKVVVGQCTAGTEPYFVTDLKTGTTSAFGAAQGLFDPNYELTQVGNLSNGNLLTAQSLSGDDESYVFDVSDAAPRVVPLGSNDVWQGIAVGVSNSGLVSVGLPSGSGSTNGGVVLVDAQTGAVRQTWSAGPSSDQPIPYAVNDAGQVVGVGNGEIPFVGVIPAN